MAERLRTPLNDWNETRRAVLERGAREARSIHRHAHAPAEEPAHDQAEEAPRPPSLECACPSLLLSRPSLVVSERAVQLLQELEQVQADVERGRTMTRRDAEWFQPKLAALVSFTGGGVLRPGSVSGLFLEQRGVALQDQVAEIRAAGYEGPLTLALVQGDCLVLRLVAFKNQGAREDEQRRLGGYRYVLPPGVSRLVLFFSQQLRAFLEPRASNAFLFVQTRGRDKGSWFNAKKDAFGHQCGHEHGLNVGTSIRMIRHAVSTEAVQRGLSEVKRADMAAANLHSLAVAGRYYVLGVERPQPAAETATGSFINGLGLSARRLFSPPLTLAAVYRLFPQSFLARFGLPLSSYGAAFGISSDNAGLLR